MDDELRAWLRDYRPQGIPRETWDNGLGEFVRSCIVDLDPEPEACKRYTRVLANHSYWCQSKGLPLDREAILTPDVVEYYWENELYKTKGGETYRSDLRRICPHLTKRAPWEPKSRHVAKRSLALPYTEPEVAGLWRVLNQQSTEKRHQIGRAVFLLGLGAGLDGRWLRSITAADFRRSDGQLVVDVPAPQPRAVPIMRALEKQMQRLLDHYPEGSLVGYEGKSKNGLSNNLATLYIPSGLPALQAGRLRSTWLRNHLMIGTRLPELAQAAGLKGITVLSDLMSTIKPYPFTKYREILAGDEWTFEEDPNHVYERDEG